MGSGCKVQLVFGELWFQCQVYFRVFVEPFGSALCALPSGQHGDLGVVKCSCSSVLKVLGMLFRIRSTHAQLREIPAVSIQCYGVAFLSSFFLTVSGTFQLPGPSLFALLARKLGTSFSTLSYTFCNCVHFWGQAAGRQRGKGTHGGLPHSLL